MIVTINVNPALDHVLWIDDLTNRGTIRATSAIDCIGGKGADTALVLARLGAKHQLISFLAGEYGKLLETMYLRNQIDSKIVWKTGETRVVTVIIETKSKGMTQISQPGFKVSEEELRKFLQEYEAVIHPGDWVIAAGSLPQGVPNDFYAQVTEIAHSHGCKVLVDTAGEPMRKAIEKHPELIKFNSAEYAKTFRSLDVGAQQDYLSPAELIKKYALEGIVITHGPDGLELFLVDKHIQAKSPTREVVNAAGAGDAVSAGLVYRRSLGDSWQEALRWACASGAAVVSTEATADCNLDEITGILPHIQLEEKLDIGNLLEEK